MRLISLEISNFRVIKNATLEFPDRVIGIVGPNGAGKSSIIEAIAWALYGNQAARSGKEEIKSCFATASESCQVDLSFAINEEKYRVVRRLVGRTDRAEVELYRGDSSESVGISDTKDYIGQLLGLDWRGFLTSFLARQQELNALSDLQPSKRKDHLAGMLGIEKLDKAIRKAKDTSKELGGHTTFLERQLAESGQIQALIGELTQRVSRLGNEEQSASSKSTELKAGLDVALEEFNKQQQLKTDWMKLTAERDALLGTKSGLNEHLGKLKAEKETLLQRQDDLQKLKSCLSDYDNLKKRHKDMSEIKSRLEVAREFRRQLEEISEDLDNWRKQREEKRRQQNDKSKIIQDIDSEIEKKSEEKLVELEHTRELYSEKRSREQSIAAEMSRLEKQLGAISEFGPESVCDRCLRPLGDDLPGIKNHLREEQKKLTASLAGAKQELEKLRACGDRLKRESEELQTAERKRSEASTFLKSLETELAGIDQNLATLKLKQERMQKQVAGLGVLEFDVDSFNKIECRLAEMDKQKAELNQIEGTLARLPAIDRDFRELSEKMNRLLEDLKVNEQRLETLNFDEKKAEAVSGDLETVRTKWEAARSSHQGVIKELELCKKDLDGKLEHLASFEKMAKQLEEMRENRFYTEKLGSLFGQFRTHLISSIRPTLSDISSRLVAEMSDGKYSMVELDKKYNLRLLDYGAYFGVERFSGGEKDLANLCLRLAISLALTDSAGLSRTFIILDEVFASQDSGRRDLIVESLAGLKNRFPQIFLVTHLDELKDKVESLIEVKPSNQGWSELIVDGQVS